VFVIRVEKESTNLATGNIVFWVSKNPHNLRSLTDGCLAI